MKHLPIFLDVTDSKIIVDGGGTTAARRVERALSAGAKIEVFDARPSDELKRVLTSPNVQHFTRPVEAKDLQGCIVAYGASEDPSRDKKLHKLAKQNGTLVNVADVKPLCDFITPSVVERSPITIAISTGGAAPIIARILRARIEAMLPKNYGGLAQFLSGFRTQIEDKFSNGRHRRRFWETLIEGPVSDAYLSGEEGTALDLIEQQLSGTSDNQGIVHIVDDPGRELDLINFRALAVMQKADFIVHDVDTSKEFLALTRRDATRILAADTSAGQLAELTRDGARVAWVTDRRSGTVAQANGVVAKLSRLGIPVQVVPSASGSGQHVDGSAEVVALTGVQPDPIYEMSLAPRATL